MRTLAAMLRVSRSCSANAEHRRGDQPNLLSTRESLHAVSAFCLSRSFHLADAAMSLEMGEGLRPGAALKQ